MVGGVAWAAGAVQPRSAPPRVSSEEIMRRVHGVFTARRNGAAAAAPLRVMFLEGTLLVFPGGRGAAVVCAPALPFAGTAQRWSAPPRWVSQVCELRENLESY